MPVLSAVDRHADADRDCIIKDIDVWANLVRRSYALLFFFSVQKCLLEHDRYSALQVGGLY